MTNSKHFQSFKNPQIILASFNDKRLATISNSSCWYEQDDHGPTYLVIRRNATDEQLIKLSKRFHLNIDTLKLFRQEAL